MPYYSMGKSQHTLFSYLVITVKYFSKAQRFSFRAAATHFRTMLKCLLSVKELAI